MRKPGYTVEDLVFMTGLMGGIGVTHFAMNALVPGTNRFVSLFAGLIVGLGLGWVFLRAYNSYNNRPPNDDGFSDNRNQDF
ncbi:MAG: hypothetical protein N2C14_29720 [Planctomycetales bacterium]